MGLLSSSGRGEIRGLSEEVIHSFERGKVRMGNDRGTMGELRSY